MRASPYRLVLALATTLVVFGVLAGAAGATDYCVEATVACGPKNIDSLEKALGQADDGPDADRIFLGAGTYTAPDIGGFQYYQAAGPVEIVGAGRGQTILTSPAGGDFIVGVFGGPGTSIHDLTIQLPQNIDAGTAGLMTTNAARRIEVVEESGHANGRYGVVLDGGGTLEDSSVTLDEAGGAVAVNLGSGGGAVRRSVLRAGSGVWSRYGGTIEGTRIAAVHEGVRAERNTTSISTSLIRLTGAYYSTGILAATDPGYDTALSADSVTIIGNGAPNSIGAIAGNESDNTHSADLSLTNSIIRGFPVPLAAQGNGAGHGRVSASYSDYDPTGNSVSGPSAGITDANVSNVGDAGFVDAAAGDYRLLPGSPLVDAGDPAASQGFDLDGTPLIADGNGDSVARRDLGAFELQRAASGSQGGAPQGAPSDTAAPLISAFRAAPARFAVRRRTVPLAARIPRGTRFRYSLSEPARVRLIIQRTLPGRRAGSRCVRPTAELRLAKRCIRYLTVGKLSGNARSGANSTRFAGRFGRRALRPGRYRALISATDTAGNRAAPRMARFRIVRG